MNGAAPGQSDHLEIWDPSTVQDKKQEQAQPAQQAGSLPSTPAIKPLFELWSPAHNASRMELSSSGLLSVPGYVGDVHVSIITV